MLLFWQGFREMELNRSNFEISGIFSGGWVWFPCHFLSLSWRKESSVPSIWKAGESLLQGFRFKKSFWKMGPPAQRQWMRIESIWKSSVYSKEMMKQLVSSHVYNMVCYNTRTSPFLDSINKPYLQFYFAPPASSQRFSSAFGTFLWGHDFAREKNNQLPPF